MKHLYAFDLGDVANLSLVRAELDRARIAYIIRNDGFVSAAGALPFTECHPEIWILDDTDFYRAQRVVRDWLTGGRQQTGSWKCPACGELLEAQFERCWNCDSSRDQD